MRFTPRPTNDRRLPLLSLIAATRHAIAYAMHFSLMFTVYMMRL